MAARRLILAMLILLVLSSVLAALVPVERDRLDESSSSTTTSTAAPLPAGELISRTIAADDATPERIELALGDQLELTVTASKLADQVEIPVLGELEDVDPDFPARFDVLALEAGRFDVRLVEADRVIARIDVAKRPDQPKRRRSPSSSDLPGSSVQTRTSGASSAT